MTFNNALVWFRRDLRDYDRAALVAAPQSFPLVHCAYVFDHELPDGLPTRDYPAPIIEREKARQRTPARYGKLRRPVSP